MTDMIDRAAFIVMTLFEILRWSVALVVVWLFLHAMRGGWAN